jgi:hypothetical protein
MRPLATQMRFYSFIFLLSELTDELGNCYVCVRKLLESLPHQL